MSGLAQHKDLGELTEASYIGMAGDYFSALDRIKEIDKHLKASADARAKLPAMKAFESFAEYLAIKRLYDSFDELASPVIDRLEKEKEEKEKQIDSLEEQLVELLPFGVWFRYGDQAMRVEWMDGRDGEMCGLTRKYNENCVPALGTRAWRKVAPIPKAATRRATLGVGQNPSSEIPMSWRDAGWPIALTIATALVTIVAVVEIVGTLFRFAL